MSQLAGKNVVFSGRFTRKKAELVDEVKALGAILKTKVSRSGTDLLVEGTKGGVVARANAETWGIPIVDEATLQAFLDGNGSLPFEADPEIAETTETAPAVEETPVEETSSATPAFDVSGKTVVVTGKFQELNRNDVIFELESRGAKVSGSVSKKTAYLIVGERAGSKLAKAQKLGIPTLTEADFKEILKAETTVDVAEKKAKEVKLPAFMEGKRLLAFNRKNVCMTGKFKAFKKKELQVVLEASGAVVQSSPNSRTHYMISGDSWGDKLRKGIANGASVWSEGEILLELEGRKRNKFPEAKDFPNGKNLDALEAIETGETVFNLPQGEEGELVLKWKRVPFKVHQHFGELFGMALLKSDTSVVGKFYLDGKPLKPRTKEFYGAESFNLGRFWENGSDYYDDFRKFDGKHGFNCSMLNLRKKLHVNWNKSGGSRVYQVDMDLEGGGWYWDISTLCENVWLTIDLEENTFSFTYHMGPYVVAPHEPWGQ